MASVDPRARKRSRYDGEEESNRGKKASNSHQEQTTPRIRRDGTTWFNNKLDGMLEGHQQETQLTFPQLLDEELQPQVSLEDISVGGQIEHLLLSTFCCDQEFIAPLLRPDTGMKVVLVLHGGDDKRGQGASTEQLSPNILAVYPALQRFGVMHAKLIMIKFKSGALRVVISSANLTDVDWTMYMQNIWFQDFQAPSHSEANSCQHFFPIGPQDFERYLRSLMNQWTVPIAVANDFLTPYDFTKANAILVASCPGSYMNEGSMKEEPQTLLNLSEALHYFSVSQLHKYGHMRARAVRCIQNLQIAKVIVESFPELDEEELASLLSAILSPEDIGIQSSSLGSINQDFLLQLYKSFNGISFDNDSTSAAISTASGENYVRILQNLMKAGEREAVGRLDKLSLDDEGTSPTRIIWPTEDFVVKSRYGWRGAGMVHFQGKFWNRAKPAPFPKGSLHSLELIQPAKTREEYTSSGSYVCAHSKVVFPQLSLPSLQPVAASSYAHTVRSWVYVGSANCSAGAFGRNSKPKRSNQVKQFISNYELGVILPPMIYIERNQESSSIRSVSRRDISGFNYRFHLLSQKYTRNDQPWITDRMQELQNAEMSFLQSALGDALR